MAVHSCIINAWSLSEFVGFCLSTCLLRIDHKFSMGLRSGEFPGHGPKISMFCSPSHLVITFALWQGAPSCWKRHCSSPNCSWMVGRSCSRRMCWSSKRQDCLLKLIQLRDQGTTSTELAQEWQQAGVSASARTVRRRLLEDGLVSRRAAKKPLLSRKNIRDRLIFCKRYRDWTAEDWG